MTPTSTEINETCDITKPNQRLRIGSRDKNVGWYSPTLEHVPEVQRDLLENYSHIAPEHVIPHILEIRDRAWEIHPHPCIGQLRFTDLSLSRAASYSSIIRRLQNGHCLLDLGCCFAQDLRKLIHDGAPAENLWGADLKGEFIELSYDLFQDKDTLGVHFMTADLFDPESPLKQLEGKMDIIHIGLFLHLFDLDGQRMAAERVVALAKKGKGALIVGQQVGSTQPGPMPRGSSSKMYKHDEKTFEELWKYVGEKTGSEWEVRAKLDAGLGISEKKRTWDDPNTRRLIFEVERIK